MKIKMYCGLPSIRNAKFKFRKVTEHYGIVFNTLSSLPLFYIYRTRYGVPYFIVTGFYDRKYAIKECKYLEKLNKDKFERGIL